jgi:hypothetical protein
MYSCTLSGVRGNKHTKYNKKGGRNMYEPFYPSKQDLNIYDQDEELIISGFRISVKECGVEQKQITFSKLGLSLVLLLET